MATRKVVKTTKTKPILAWLRVRGGEPTDQQRALAVELLAIGKKKRT